MKATILITGEKKEKYLLKTIKSCLDQSYSNFEVILLYSKLNNLKKIKKIFNNKIRYLKIKRKISNPVKDQFFKIYKGIRSAKGEFIFLLDGDDIFKKKKLEKIMRHKNKKNLFLDDHLINYKNKLIHPKNNFLKKFFFYKLIFNPWPSKVCTSCISGNKKLFENFFKQININKIENMAIDIMITIYYLDKIFNLHEILTVKKDTKYGVDKKYSFLFSKIYWERRIEQHIYLKKIKKINYSLEFYICKIIFIIFDFHKYIRKIF